MADGKYRKQTEKESALNDARTDELALRLAEIVNDLAAGKISTENLISVTADLLSKTLAAHLLAAELFEATETAPNMESLFDAIREVTNRRMGEHRKDTEFLKKLKENTEVSER